MSPVASLTTRQAFRNHLKVSMKLGIATVGDGMVVEIANALLPGAGATWN